MPVGEPPVGTLGGRQDPYAAGIATQAYVENARADARWSGENRSNPEPPAIENLCDWMEQANGRLEEVLLRLTTLTGGEHVPGSQYTAGTLGLEQLSGRINTQVHDLESLVESLSNRIGRL